MAEFVSESEENFLDATPTIVWSESDSRAMRRGFEWRGFTNNRPASVRSQSGQSESAEAASTLQVSRTGQVFELVPSGKKCRFGRRCSCVQPVAAPLNI